MRLLSAEEMHQLLPAETHAFRGPVPTQIVSSEEYFPTRQTAAQREVEARIRALGDELGARQGLSRRAFFRTAAGMAAAYVAMNEVYGPLFAATRAEAADKDMAAERAKALAGQFIMDTHTHFLKDDTRLTGFVRMREAVGRAGWNPGLAGRPQTIEDLKFDNYFKEIFLDSDTKVALISSAPSDVPSDWFLTNEMMAQARATVNARLGGRRLLTHAIFTPGQPGWMEALERALVDLKPDSMKGYTIGDNTNKDQSRHPWRLDDEKLLYPAYEKMAKAGVVNVCIHKGLFAPALDQRFPNLRAYCDVRDVGKAAKDWPQLNFIIYHGAYRFAGGGDPADALAQFEQTGRVEWVTRPGRDPRQVRGEQRLRRSRPALRADHGRPAAPHRGPHGHAGARDGRRPRHLGNRRGVDRRAAMADRRAAPARDPGGHAAKARLRAARGGRRPGEDRDLRGERRAPLSLQPPRGARGTQPARRAQGRVRAARDGPQQPPLRLRRARLSSAQRAAAGPTHTHTYG